MTRLHRNRAVYGLLLLAIAGAVAFVALVRPEGQAFWPKCLFHFTTGLHCPGCGGTRSLHLLAHGDVVGAFRQNALFLLIGIPLGLWLYIAGIRYVMTGEYRGPRIANRGVSVALVVVVLAFLVLRNIPFEPFSNLAPQPLHADAQR